MKVYLIMMTYKNLVWILRINCLLKSKNQKVKKIPKVIKNLSKQIFCNSPDKNWDFNN